jgi:hypothetical protein
MDPQQLAETGFVTVPNVLSARECEGLISRMGALDSELPGTRGLLSQSWCQSLVAQLRQNRGLAAVIPADFVAAQCTYFEKSVSLNWIVPVHQDLSIPVKARVSHPELRVWSEKEGVIFVQPPAELLEQLVAVRIHLDACGIDDGPLQIVPATHLRGRIAADTASEMRRAGPVVSCTAGQGDVLVMRPLVLHASSKATGTSKRRVLHILFGPPELPYGLKWPHA